MNQVSLCWRWVTFHVLLVLLVFGSRLICSPGTTLIIGGVLTMPLYIAIGVAEGRQAPLWFTPLSFYFLWYSVGLGASAVYLGWLLWRGDEILFSVTSLGHDEIASAYLVFLCGSLFLHVGLRLMRPRTAISNDRLPRGRTSLVALVIFWALGLWAVLDVDRSGAIGTPGRVLQYAGLAAVAAFALSFQHFRLPSGVATALLLIGTAGVFVANVATYSKAYAMYSFLPLVWMSLVERRYRRMLIPLSVGLAFGYFGIVAPVLMTARLGPATPREASAERLLMTLDQWISGQMELANGNFYVDQVDALLMRQFDPFPIAYLISEVETYGFRYGETMRHAGYSFIPRIIWPNKPEVTQGAWFTAYTGFAASPEEATTALGITAPGELYWNFGVIGVAVGMLLVGLVTGYLWRVAGSDPRNDMARMLLYIIVMINLSNMSEFVSIVVTSVALCAIFHSTFLATRILYRTKDEVVTVESA